MEVGPLGGSSDDNDAGEAEDVDERVRGWTSSSNLSALMRRERSRLEDMSRLEGLNPGSLEKARER